MKNFLNNQLIKACEKGNTFLAKLCLMFGADANVKNEYRNPLLIIATGYGYKGFVELLIAAGADVNAKNKYGNTALIISALHGREEIAELLKRNGAKENKKDTNNKHIGKMSTKKNTINLLNNIFNTNKFFSDSHEDSYYQEFKKVQSPHTTYVGCCDSRVHLNSISDNPKNEIFTINNIGNQLATNQGSVDFGIKVLNTPFLLIVGHSDCGAIRAAIAGGETGMPEVDKELSTFKIDSKDVNKAIRENVNTQVQIALERYRDKVDSGELVVIGMLYDFKNVYKLGYGKIILVNVNGNTNKKHLNSAYADKVKNLITRDV